MPRFAYLEGELQIMSPSLDHERIKSVIGCLVEVNCLESEIEFSTLGSWTLERKAKACGLEPDECYVFGDGADATVPDLAIEVVWTSGGLRKLDVYRGLEVPEVWFWQRGSIAVYVLREGEYAAANSSTMLPELDIAQLACFIDRPTTSSAIRAYRAALSCG